MRSSRRLARCCLAPARCRHLAAIIARAAAAVLCALARTTGCGADTDPGCDRSFLGYDNFGSPFIVSRCRACQSVDIPTDMRQRAPAEINFDNLPEIRHWATQIKRSAGETQAMPPAGGPPPSERQMLVEWLGCGAPRSPCTDAPRALAGSA
jgi:uncharacterized membrane protein